MIQVRVQYRRTRSAVTVWLMMATAAVCAIMLPGRLSAQVPWVQTGGYFTTAKDLNRMKAQANSALLKEIYDRQRVSAESSVAKWEKLYPAHSAAPTTKALLAAGEADASSMDGSYIALAQQTALDPTERNRRVLREMMIYAIGQRHRIHNWRGQGIHEGIAVSEFLQTYDIAAQLHILDAEDHVAIRDEMHQAGHYFEGWLLDNDFSRMYDDKREEAWCLNFHVMSADALAWISMLYPEFPESADWLHQSQSQLISYLMNGYGEDGVYGEGSSHYWELSTRGLLDYVALSKNLGVADYTTIPAVMDRLQRTLRWRLDITAPDGGAFAFGDANRDSAGGGYLILGGALLHDPVLTWGGRMTLQRTHDWPPAEPYPILLAHIDLSLPAEQPTRLAGLYPLSGFASFRSSWDANANALFFKFGPSFLGRRQAEPGPVISGHAHEDVLEFELHYRGVPVMTDTGRHGAYENWLTYGGYSKATIAHSTVGLGNPWGFDRLDGLYEKHQAEHGPDFTYERTQKNIGPADTKLMAFGDVGALAFSSAKVKTYDTVEQQRSIVWLPDESLTIVADHMESAEEQPYEWYLTPTGNPMGMGSDLVFGDTEGRLQVLPILPTDEKRTVITPDTPNVPPYYAGFVHDQAPGVAAAAKHESRWETTSMLVFGKTARTTDFLNVLVPYSSEKNPWTEVTLGASARRLTLNGKQVDISGQSVTGPLTVAGQCGVVTSNSGNQESYALIEGTKLRAGNQVLVSAFLKTDRWTGRYVPALNALVSLKDKRASFDLKPWPGDAGMLLNPPRAVPGKEPTALLLTSVTFHVSTRPEHMLIFHGYAPELKLKDPAAEAKTKWPNDYLAPVYKRQVLDFDYDAEHGTVTVLLEPGEHQVVWE